MSARRKLDKWTWSPEDRTVRDSLGRVVAKIPDDSPWGTLMAAAPLLLRACESAASNYSLSEVRSAMRECAEAAKEATQ